MGSPGINAPTNTSVMKDPKIAASHRVMGARSRSTEEKRLTPAPGPAPIRGVLVFQ